MLAGGADVAFEADGVDQSFRWSVVVHGRSRRLDADDEIEASGAGWTFAKLTIANAAIREIAAVAG